MRKRLIILFSIGLGAIGYAQKTYIDPTTTGALFMYSKLLGDEQRNTQRKLVNLTKAQTVIGGAMIEVNNIQNKLYKGLKEVSATLRNGIQIKNIYDEMKLITKYSKEVSILVKNHPQYSIFAHRTFPFS